MSRLDSFIRRMAAQRDCLDWAAREIAGRPGPALELGLGNGRTYDHLREILPGREIFVFDRRMAAHPACIPDADHFFLGEIVETLPRAAKRLGATAMLAHVDVGTGDEAANAALAERLGPAIDALMAEGGIVVSDQAIPRPGWEPLPLPEGVPEGRYHLYRVGR